MQTNVREFFEYQFNKLKLEIDISDSFIICLMFLGLWLATENDYFAGLGFVFLILIGYSMNQKTKLEKGFKE